MKHRAAALLALAFLLATMVLFAVLVSGAFWRWVVAILLAGVAVMAAWTAVTRTGVVRWIASAVALGCLVLLIVLTITADTHGVTLANRGPSPRGVDVARPLRPAPMPAGRRHRPSPDTPLGPAGRSVLVVNPKSGDGKAEAVGLVDYAKARGVECVVLKPEDDFPAVVEQVLASGVDAIGMAGGDGSQALVASVATRYDVPMVCVPAGTRNHFALDLGLNREDVTGAVDAFAEALERRVDLATVNDRVFVNNCSLGLYAKIVQSPEYRGAKARTTTAKLTELLGPDAPSLGLRFTGPDGAVNTRPRSSRCPTTSTSCRRSVRSALASGSTRACSASPPWSYGARATSPSLPRSKHEAASATSSACSAWSTPEFTVEADSGMEVAIDGEAVVLPSPVTFRSVPGAVRVRIPVHAPGASPAGLRAPSWQWTLTALGRVGATGRWPAVTSPL